MCWCYCCFEWFASIPALHFLLIFFPSSASSSSTMASLSIPASVPSPAEDAQAIRKAVQGWGTDETALIEILCHRSSEQRAEIAKAYADLCGESLLDRLHSELSGDFRNAMKLWTMDPAERDAQLANKALRKKGDRHIWVLIEVSCAYSSDHLIAVRRAYTSLYSSSIEEDVASSSMLKPELKNFLVRLMSSYRYGGERTDGDAARAEAAVLREAVTRKELNCSELIRIISSRSKAQLKATFQHYERDFGTAIDEDIMRCNAGQFSGMLKAAVWCLTSPEKHFAEVIRTSIVGLGTDEDMLTRAVVSRAELDMERIKEVYRVMYPKKTVTRDIVGDTSGYYKQILLALVGPESS